jgi:hypothetical protein
MYESTPKSHKTPKSHIGDFCKILFKKKLISLITPYVLVDLFPLGEGGWGIDDVLFEN